MICTRQENRDSYDTQIDLYRKWLDEQPGATDERWGDPPATRIPKGKDAVTCYLEKKRLEEK